MNYKTIYCHQEEADHDLNMLAQEGWRVQSFKVAWVDIDPDTGSHMPWYSYLLFKESPQPAQPPQERPERRVIGRAG